VLLNTFGCPDWVKEPAIELGFWLLEMAGAASVDGARSEKAGCGGEFFRDWSAMIPYE
jgi:hypothetical protein